MLPSGWAAFAAGVCLLIFLPVLPDARGMLLAALAVLAAGLRYPRLSAAGWLLAGLAWGVWQADRYLADRLDSRHEGRLLRVEARVRGLPEPAPHQRVRLRIEAVRDLSGLPAWPSGRLWDLNAPAGDYRPGDRWRMEVVLKRPVGAVSPGAFDAEAWYMTEGVTATGRVRTAVLLARGGWSVDGWRLRIRDRFHALTADKPQAGLVLSLLTGDRALITDPQRALYRDTGILHLIAISGPHVLMFALAVTWSLQRLLGIWPGVFRRYPFFRLRWPVMLAAATAYAVLAGASLPTLRTLVMLAVCAVAGMAGRRPDPWGVLARALAIVLLWQPLSVHAAGFWLSFVAVALICLRAGHGGSGEGPAWRSLPSLQGYLFLALMPLSLLFFGQVSLVSPLANLVAVPLIGMVVAPMALAGLPLSGLWEHAGQACWFWAACLLEMLDLLLRGLLSGPLPVWRLQTGLLSWALLSLAIALLLAPRRLVPRSMALVLGVAACYPEPPRENGSVRLSVLDVGQGLAVLVQTRRHHLLYDTGPTEGAGEGIVLPYLRAGGVRRLDSLVLSHNDLDHTGGAQAVLGGLPVGSVLFSARPEFLADGTGPRPGFCRAGEGWRWDGVEFLFLAPGPEAADMADNDRSCVLRVRGEGFAFLIAGDIEAPAEAILARSAGAGPVDLLVVPHHGSRTSSTPAFLRAFRPRLGVISAGYRNRFGHPHPGIVRRYREAGVRLDSTVAGGTLVYQWRPGGALQASAARDRRHYWRILP